MQPLVEVHDDFQILFESAPDLLYTQDLAGRLTRVNRAFELITGFSRVEIVGSSIYDLVVPEHREAFTQRVMERMGGAPTHPFEVDFLTKRTRVPLELSIEIIFHCGIPAGIQGFGRDLTEKLRERMERAAADETLLRQTEQLATFSRYLQLLHRLSTTSYSNLDDLFADYLNTGCEIFSLDCGAITEVSLSRLITRKTCGEPSAAVDQAAAAVLRAGETILTANSPAEAASFYVGTPLKTGESHYGVLAFWSADGLKNYPRAKEMIEMMARGIESSLQQRRLNDELQYRAMHDSLTGLANRTFLAEQLDASLSEADRLVYRVAVLFIDLDKFKAVNDSFGHVTGDLALQEIAGRFQKAAGSRCFLARVGGDEFVAFTRAIAHQAEAIEIAEELLKSLKDPVQVHGHVLDVTASVGVSLFPQDGGDADTLLRKADLAMYAAKQSGENIVRCAFENSLPRR